MKISTDKLRDISEKKIKLEKIKNTLKQEFFGIDNVIDDLCKIILPWLLFPEHLTRPITVNLWGMTGVGKTSLINRLIELLDLNHRFIKFDMGEYQSEYNCGFDKNFDGDMKAFENKPCIICIDEFQHIRTINEEAHEIHRPEITTLWELLDSGLLEYREYSYDTSISDLQDLYRFLKKCLLRKVNVKNGKVMENAEFYIKIAHERYHLNPDLFFNPQKNHFIDKEIVLDPLHKIDLEKKKIFNGQIHFFPRNYIENIFEIMKDNYDDIYELEEHLDCLDGYETLRLIENTMFKLLKKKKIDLSKSLIFILGNLDEAYKMYNELNPDIDPDDFYKYTLKIGNTEINSALQKRFRNEQIARLGNNHIIYPAISTKAYHNWISSELEQFCKKVCDLYGIDIEFDRSLNQLIFDEGVFPAMGFRPLKTTFVNLIESYFTNIMTDMLYNNSEFVKISWFFDKAESTYEIRSINSEGEITHRFNYPLTLALSSKRKPLKDNKQALVAIHEAGHAIASLVATRILPISIASTSAVNINGGYCKTGLEEEILSFRLIKHQIIEALGGYLAERLIFGEDLTSSGVCSDIERATELAALAIRSFAMGNDKVNIGVEDPDMLMTVFSHKKHEEEVVSLIEQCKKECEDILKRNKRLLLELGNFLADYSRIESEQIRELATKYSNEEWIKNNEFVASSEYYQYRAILKDEYTKPDGILSNTNSSI